MGASAVAATAARAALADELLDLQQAGVAVLDLQRAVVDVEALLANPNVRKFVDWVAKKDPDFTASTSKKQR